MSINKKAIAATFGRAASSYLKHNELQQRSSNKLLSLLPKRNFGNVLDAGCGPGNDSRFWRKIGNHVTALDLSLLMLLQARVQESADIYLVADIEAIPLSNAIFDLVWSHLAVQWCENLSLALTELYRVTKPGGHIAFTTLLTNSLPELNQAWLAVDTQSHTNSFVSRETIDKIIASWRVNYCEQTVTLNFDNALSAMRSLKGVGANYLHKGRSPISITKYHMQLIERAWPKYNNYYPLTYKLFHGVIERD